jgi:zinc transporter, ZIP family
MSLNFVDIRSIIPALEQPAVATLFAFAGIGIGIGIRRIALHRLSLLVAAAMGVLLAVTIFDVLPDAKQFLVWPVLLLATSSGYLLLWAIGRYVYHVCPACAVNSLKEPTGPDPTKIATMMLIAGSIHCAMDGLGIVFGDNLLGHPDMGLLAGLSLHKLPEGLALILLFLGAGFQRRKATIWAASIETMTLLGGMFGYFLVTSSSRFWLGVLFAQVAGGFFYMIVSTTKGVLGQHNDSPRYVQHALVSGISFVSSAVLLALAAN